MTTENRTLEIEGLEIRQADHNQAPSIAGYAVVFDAWSEPLADGRGRPFRERFAAGAFDRWLATNPDIRALWNHNSDFPLGRTRNGTLRVAKDGHGIRFEIDPPGTSWGADALASIQRGDVSGVSFEFATKRDGTSDHWERPGGDGIAFRTVLDADLREISPVVFPAYPATQVAVRAVEVPEFGEPESDGRAAGEIDDSANADSRAAAAAHLQHLDILRSKYHV